MITVSNPALAAIYAERTSAIFAYLLTLTFDLPGSPIRLCNQRLAITSRGNIYTPLPFEVAPPSESAGELPRVEIAVENVTRLLVDTLRTLTVPLSAVLEIVLVSSPDTVERGPWPVTLKLAEWDKDTVRLELGYEDLLNEPFPHAKFAPLPYPALFNAVDR